MQQKRLKGTNKEDPAYEYRNCRLFVDGDWDEELQDVLPYRVGQ